MSVLDWFSRAEPRPSTAPLTIASAERLAEIHESAFARPWDVLDFERLLTDRNVLADGLFLGAGREPVGFALSRRVIDEAELLSLALAPEARGRRLAHALLEAHLDALLKRGVRRVHLEVEEGNAPALALYRRGGFVEVGRRQAYYHKPDGRRAEAVTMTRSL
jgi:[ribosomal protein S18]-alanine N-acetyltransferase